MSKWLPRPLLSVSLLLIWLLLNQSLSLGQWLLGLVIAIAVPVIVQPLMGKKTTIHRPFVLFKLLAWSLVEISRSCFNVSVIILSRHRALNSEFIKIPLDMTDEHGLALLSCLINCTPGTVWVEILPNTHELSLHVFDFHDEQWWIDTIKTRYEKPLMEIFEGAAHATRA